MRIAAVFVLALVTAASAAAEPATIEELFQQFGLFGTWANDCKQPATRANPHVTIFMPSPGLVLEDHDNGAAFERNRYSMLQAARVSESRLSVDVIFLPGTPDEERQKLVFEVRDGTRRTIFNQPDGGEVRVREGIALGNGAKTPMLKKCE
jgi:hypothetical protein